MSVLRNLSISYRLKRCRVGVSVLNTVYYKMRMQNSYNVDTNRTGTVMHNINVNTGNIRIEVSECWATDGFYTIGRRANQAELSQPA